MSRRSSARPESAVINLGWIIRLRFVATVGQAVTVAAVSAFSELHLPIVPIAGVIALAFASNVALGLLARERPSPPEWVIGATLGLDVLLLTGLLSLSGGAHNPFNFLYLVHVTLAAVSLRPRWSWSLLGLSAACFAILFVEPPWRDQLLSHAALMQMHLHGMWVAFMVAAGNVVYFVHLVRIELRRRNEELQVARERSDCQERLTSLATLAAGAAHELSTPLSTIALVSKELQQRLTRDGVEAQAEDAALIRSEVERCRAVLAQMAMDAGQPAGEARNETTLRALVDEAIEPLHESNRIQVSLGEGPGNVSVFGPNRVLVRALRGLAKNALQSSAAEVQLRVEVDGAKARIEVRDAGAGMPPEVFARAGEPFFTTREPGQGMGLGLYLTRSVAESIGGELQLHSAPGEGTVAILILPVRNGRGPPLSEVA